MSLNILWIFSVLTLLKGVSGFTHAVPAPYNVSVSCNSYGVMVDWKADHPTGQAEFLLQLKPDYGNSVNVSTKRLQYNITDLLQDTTYNHYIARVLAISGDANKSEFAESQIFSFNFCKSTARIICGLDFPKINPIYQNGTLLVTFTNPLYLYRYTPGLRHPSMSDKLRYILKTNKTSEECLKCLDCGHECTQECILECSLGNKVCESRVSFPEDQKEYCFTLLGRIKQTPVWETKPFCYPKPGPPVAKYLIMALGSFAAFLVVFLLIVFFVKNFFQKIRKNITKIWPTSLMLEKFPNKYLEKPLDPVPKNIVVGPPDRNHPDNTCSPEEITMLLKNAMTTSSKDLHDYAEDTDMETSSESIEENTSSNFNSPNEYDTDDLPLGYDMKHVEMSSRQC